MMCHNTRNPGDSVDTLCKIENPHRASQGVFDLVSHAEIGKRAAGATGADWVQVWWVQLLYKPPGVETESTRINIGWHQDRNYWKSWEEGARWRRHNQPPNRHSYWGRYQKKTASDPGIL